MPKTKKQMVGAWGEQEATFFLQELGYTIIERNFRTRFGELDIIAWHHKSHFGNTLCFIEVKTRANEDGSAQRATDSTKLKHLFSAARAFCVQKNIHTESTPIQFEQVSVFGSISEKKGIKHSIIPVE